MENVPAPRPRHEREPETHEHSILRQFLEQIDSGLKTLELRTAWDSWLRIKTGDYINFHAHGTEKRVKVKVLQIRKYHSIEDILEHEDINKIAPGMDPETAKQKAVELFRERDKTLLILEIEKVNQ